MTPNVHGMRSRNDEGDNGPRCRSRAHVVFLIEEVAMTISKANAEWNGNFKAGRGVMRPENGGAEVPFSVATRFEGQKGSNPEELIGAALAGCFSMALSLGLEKAGVTPQSIRTSARTHLEKEGDGFGIPRIELSTEVRATGDEAKIRSVAEETKKGCPVSKVLRAQIDLEVKVVSG
jgi:osmotically inducible protein OsmC